MPLDEATSLTQEDVEQFTGIEFERDSADGWEEYSYKLEYFDPERGKWRYLKNFW